MSNNVDVTNIYNKIFEPLVEVIRAKVLAERYIGDNKLPPGLVPRLVVKKDDYYHYTIFITSADDYRVYFSAQINRWNACCALMYISRLTIFQKDWVNDGVLIAAIKASLFDGFFTDKMSMHRIYFSYSEEEISYQDKLCKLLGFVDTTPPFISCKTGNMIHTTHLDVFDAEDLANQVDNREERDPDITYDLYEE